VSTSGEEQETPSKHASMDRLCNLLRERTGEGKVQWQREESGRSIWYRTFVAGCPIHLWYAGDYPVLEVRSAYGRTLSQGRGPAVDDLAREVCRSDIVTDAILQDIIDQLDAMSDRARLGPMDPTAEKDQKAARKRASSRLPWLWPRGRQKG
jgi:hypothetical protein